MEIAEELPENFAKLSFQCELFGRTEEFLKGFKGFKLFRPLNEQLDLLACAEDFSNYGLMEDKNGLRIVGERLPDRSLPKA